MGLTRTLRALLATLVASLVLTGCPTVEAPDGSEDDSSPSFSLTIAISGSGSVTSTPPGIDCPNGDCRAVFEDGTFVTLTATPDLGSIFSGWSGDGACAGGQVALRADQACTATFQPQVAFASISAGYGQSLAIGHSGYAWGWGDNSDGQVGDDSKDDRYVPVAVTMPLP